MPAYNILILGAAYGSLLASKMLFGGHKIHHVCLPAEADLINAEGIKQADTLLAALEAAQNRCGTVGRAQCRQRGLWRCFRLGGCGRERRRESSIRRTRSGSPGWARCAAVPASCG